MKVPGNIERYQRLNEMLETIKKALSIKEESAMWDSFNAVFIKAQTYALKTTGSMADEIYACVHYDDICVIMMDTAAKSSELADEEPFGNKFPMYFTENSHRVSPVFRLHAVCEALRQHTGLNKSNISGVLLTTSQIINEEDMQEIWSAMNITVRCVRKMQYAVFLSPNKELWDNVSACLGEKPIEDFVDLSKYNEMIDNVQLTEGIQRPVKMQKAETNKRKELRLEDIIDKDDPVFHTLGSDGNTSFISANLPPIQVLAPMENATSTLEQMVGLDDIKDYITKLKSLVLFKKKLGHISGVKCPEVSLHSIFKGSPGTGKTSVALLYASVLKEAGIISKGNLLLANGRNAFMGKWVGTEEKNVRMALAAARGNVLLIDEAYTLVSPNEMDYARNVLPLMLQLLADEENRDIAVVLCGYDSEMEYLIQSNPGIRSRFPNIFKFKDYSMEELHKMAVEKIVRSGYMLTDDAALKIADVLQKMYQNKVEGQWANGREVGNLFDKVVIAHADRCISSGAEGEMLVTITAEDIPDFKAEHLLKPRRIGFQ